MERDELIGDLEAGNWLVLRYQGSILLEMRKVGATTYMRRLVKAHGRKQTVYLRLDEDGYWSVL